MQPFYDGTVAYSRRLVSGPRRCHAQLGAYRARSAEFDAADALLLPRRRRACSRLYTTRRRSPATADTPPRRGTMPPFAFACRAGLEARVSCLSSAMQAAPTKKLVDAVLADGATHHAYREPPSCVFRRHRALAISRQSTQRTAFRRAVI